MPNVLLAFDDVGMAVQLQEALEAKGHTVIWDAAQAGGPTPDLKLQPDAVLLTGGDRPEATFVDIAKAWRDFDPPPAVLVVGATLAELHAANAARCKYVEATADPAEVDATIATAITLRFAGGLRSSEPDKVALRALGLSMTGSKESNVIRIINAARKADLDTVRESLRWYAGDYVAVDMAVVEDLRKHRALAIPEVDFVPALSGTRTLQTALKSGGLDAWQAARFVWGLASIGALTFTQEPPDSSTPERRRLAMTRFHLLARRQRLAKSTYYDVLEVTPNAEPTDVQAAARIASVRYDPDRLADLDLGHLRALVAPLWKQIVEAHSTLTDWAGRGRYNRWLSENSGRFETEWADSSINAGGAAEAWKRGQQSLVDGDVYKSLSDMATACRMHPHHPVYEASLAWARFRADVTGGKGREETAHQQRQIAEQCVAGRRSWPRALLALGLLCAADGDPDAARWHLHEALACEPNLPAARQLLQRLNRQPG